MRSAARLPLMWATQCSSACRSRTSRAAHMSQCAASSASMSLWVAPMQRSMYQGGIRLPSHTPRPYHACIHRRPITTPLPATHCDAHTGAGPQRPPLCLRTSPLPAGSMPTPDSLAPDARLTHRHHPRQSGTDAGPMQPVPHVARIQSGTDAGGHHPPFIGIKLLVSTRLHDHASGAGFGTGLQGTTEDPRASAESGIGLMVTTAAVAFAHAIATLMRSFSSIPKFIDATP